MLTNKHIHQWLAQECDSYTIQPEDISMPADNAEMADSEIGRSSYYVIKVNNTKWQAEQQTRDITTGQTIPMTEQKRGAKNVQAKADGFKCFIHQIVTNRTKQYEHKH
jgi:hypothetical protein